MDSYLLLVLLFVGNAALLFLWVHYIIRVLFGQCPHCGETRVRSVFQYLASLRAPSRAAGKDSRPAY